MKVLRLVLITSICALIGTALSAQVKIGENKLESSPHHWLEIDNTDSLFIITRDLELGLTDNPHRLGISPNPSTDAIMLKLYGYGLNQFLPALVAPVSQDVELINGINSNIFLGITEDGSVLEVPMRLVIDASSTTADLSFHNGIDTFGTADLTALDSFFVTNTQLSDSTASIRTLINNVQTSDNDTITGNEYIDDITLSNDTIYFIENDAERLGTRNTQFVDLGPLIQGATFYLADGTLEEDRTVTGDNNWLRFNGLDSFEVNANSFIVLNGNQTTIQQGGQDIIQINAAEEVKFRSSTIDSILVLDDDGSLHASMYGDTTILGTVATIIAADGDGNLIETTIEDILASQPDSTIYSHDGTLTEDRVLTGANNSLTMTGLDSFNIVAVTFDIDATNTNISDALTLESFGDSLNVGTIANILAVDDDGLVIETTIEDILASDPDSTIYSHDGTLSEDRVLTGAANDLDFDGLGTFDINADSVQLSSVVQGDGFGVDDAEAFTTIIGSTADGVLIDVTAAEILATQPDSSIYRQDGTLTENRVLTGAGNDLTMTGLNNYNVVSTTVDIDATTTTISEDVTLESFGDSLQTGVLANILAVDDNGVVIETTIEDILASDPDSTIYTHDGTLTEDRVLTGAANDLDFDGLGTFDINADSVQLSSVVQGDGFGVDDAEVFTTLIGSTADGVLIDVTAAEILATQPDSSIYRQDGTLTENRVLTGAGNDLTMTGLNNYNVVSTTVDIDATTTTISEDVTLESFGDSLQTGVLANILGVDDNGVVIETTIEDILASDPDSTIYTHDGTLTDERYMTMDGNDLHFVGTTNDTIVITDDGRMAIGRSFVMTGTGTTEDVRLDVDGDILAIQVHASSDARFKKNITQLENALDKVLAIEGVTYNFRTDEFTNRNFPTKSQLGFLAQNVEEVIPQVVKTDAYGYKSIDYSKLTALLNEAIKEQQSQINVLNNDLKSVIDLNNQLLEEIRQIKKDFKAMSNTSKTDED